MGLFSGSLPGLACVQGYRSLTEEMSSSKLKEGARKWVKKKILVEPAG